MRQICLSECSQLPTGAGVLGRARLRGPDAFAQILWPETFGAQAAAASSAVVPSSATPDFSFEASCQATVSEDTAAALASEVGLSSGAASALGWLSCPLQCRHEPTGSLGLYQTLPCCSSNFCLKNRAATPSDVHDLKLADEELDVLYAAGGQRRRVAPLPSGADCGSCADGGPPKRPGGTGRLPGAGHPASQLPAVRTGMTLLENCSPGILLLQEPPALHESEVWSGQGRSGCAHPLPATSAEECLRTFGLTQAPCSASLWQPRDGCAPQGSRAWLPLKSRTGTVVGAIEVGLHAFQDTLCIAPCR